MLFKIWLFGHLKPSIPLYNTHLDMQFIDGLKSYVTEQIETIRQKLLKLPKQISRFTYIYIYLFIRRAIALLSALVSRPFYILKNLIHLPFFCYH